MGAKKTEIDYTKLVEIYNNDGKVKADEYIQTNYKLSVDYVYQRLVKDGYTYDRNHKKYLQTSKETNTFLSLEMLLETSDPTITQSSKTGWVEPAYNDEIDRLIMELIKDKLLQLNHFMKINPHSKTILLHKTAIAENGYKIIEF